MIHRVLPPVVEINSVRAWLGSAGSSASLSLIDALGMYLRWGSWPLTLRQSMASTGGSDMPGRRTGDGHLAAGAQGPRAAGPVAPVAFFAEE